MKSHDHMKAHVQITLCELDSLVTPLLNCIHKIEAAQRGAETHHNLDTVTLENEQALHRMLQSTAESVAELMKCKELCRVPHVLESVYSNINARATQVTLLADQLRLRSALVARRIALASLLEHGAYPIRGSKRKRRGI